MAKRDDLTDTLLDSPWWVSAGLGIIIWATAAILMANTSTETATGKLLHSFAAAHWLIPFFFGFTAAGAYLLAWRKRRLLANNRSQERIRALSWQQFETLAGQYFREQGYRVAEKSGGGPDGGVDLLLRLGEEKIVVQCKHWKAFTVGLSEVKELFATVHDQHATGGILLTTSRFSDEAQAFASRHAELRLVNGDDLSKMLGAEIPPPEPPVNSCVCPACGSPMKLRTAQRGRSSGSQFMGCSRYPVCKGTRSLAAAS
jgi:restriction system protein